MRSRLSPLGFIRRLLRIVRAKPELPPSLQDNPLLSTLCKRRSIRRFAASEIPEDVFAAILEAGRLAPSTVNLQTWAFAAFTPTTWRQTFGTPIPFRGQRAVMVMADTFRDRTVLDAFPQSPLVEYTIGVVNASLAAMNMNIAAEALGVSSVMLSETGRTGILDAGFLKEQLELPDGVIPLMTIIFGYKVGPTPPMPPRLPLHEVCLRGKYEVTDPAVMEEWLSQMVAGYKAMRPLSSFDSQLKLYQSKIEQAETDLQKMVFHRRMNP